MRNLIVFLIIMNVQVTANSLFSQEQVNLDLENVNLKKCIKEIDKQTKLGFLYNGKELSKVDIYQVKFTNASVEEVLDKLLKENGYTYRIFNDVLLVKKDKSYRSGVGIETIMQLDTLNVTGTVYDEEGNPLPGVSVYFEETPEIGTATDIDGKYRVTKVLDKQETLVFSFLGFEPQLIKIQERSLIDVQLKESILGLDEVVVTGYQTLSKERVTGSFGQIDDEDFEQRITTDFKSRLEGMVTGLYVDSDNEITIRGLGTLYGSSSPLIVVDGFPVEADLSTINPEDVKSITVLKDAAAASIWGVKAANGVIVVTTKMGEKNSETNINTSYYYTFGKKPDFSNLKLASSNDVVDLELDLIAAGRFDVGTYASGFASQHEGALRHAYYRRWLTDNDPAHVDAISETEYNAILTELRNTNRFKQAEEHFLRNSQTHQVNVSMNGGGERNRYFGSLSYNGNIYSSIGNSDDRININLKNEYSILERLKLSTSANLTYDNGTYNGFSAESFTYKKVFEGLVDDNGDPIQYHYFRDDITREREALGYLPYTTSLLDELDYNDITTNNFNARVQVGLNYDFTKGFSFDTKFQYERGYSKFRDHKETRHPQTRHLINTFTLEGPPLEYQVPLGGILDERRSDIEAWTWRNQLSYNKNWRDDKHQFIAIAGQEVRNYVVYSSAQKKLGYNDETLTYVPIDEEFWVSDLRFFGWYGATGMGLDYLSSYSEIDNRDVSYYANASYTFDGKYTLTGSARLDQSNLFGNDTRYRYNPLWSAGVSWKISEEGFMNDLDWLNQLTLRTTYGMSGNTNKTFYPTIVGKYEVNPFTFRETITLLNPENEDLKWETAKMFNIGTDVSLFNNRLWGTVEYYYKKSEDIIGRQALDPTNGWDFANMNYVSIDNRGLEFSINAKPVKKAEFIWETNLNVSYNKNEVIEIGVDGATLNNYLEAVASYSDVEQALTFGSFYLGQLGFPVLGQPIDRVYAYKWGGLDSNGEPMIYNENNELIPYRDFEENTDALKYMGTSTPPVFGNFRNRFSYKGLTLTLNFSYKFGHVFRAPKTGVWDSYFGAAYDNISDRWIQSGDEATKDMPGIAASTSIQYEQDRIYQFSDLHVLEADLIRLNDVSLDYNLPISIISKTPFKSINVRAQARNLWLWTANDQGYDPDALGRFPAQKIFVFGIKANF